MLLLDASVFGDGERVYSETDAICGIRNVA